MDNDENEYAKSTESLKDLSFKDASQELPKDIAGDFGPVDKFCGKITALFLPYLYENIPEKEWLRLHRKIEVCSREFADAFFEEKLRQGSALSNEWDNSICRKENYI